MITKCTATFLWFTVCMHMHISVNQCICIYASIMAADIIVSASEMDMGPYFLTQPNPNLIVLLDTQCKYPLILIWLHCIVPSKTQ